MTGQKWYVARTLRAREDLALQNLEIQGFPAFLPRLRRTIRHARKFRTTMAPLFPGYLFVSLDVERDRWRSVNGTLGVASLIMIGDRPTATPVGLVDELQRRFVAVDPSVAQTPAFAPGDRAELSTGPFASMVGQLVEVTAAGRVKMLLEIMGRQTAVSTRLDGLVPAS